MPPKRSLLAGKGQTLISFNKTLTYIYKHVLVKMCKLFGPPPPIKYKNYPIDNDLGLGE